MLLIEFQVQIQHQYFFNLLTSIFQFYNFDTYERRFSELCIFFSIIPEYIIKESVLIFLLALSKIITRPETFFFPVRICYRYCNRHPLILLFFVDIMITESWCPGKGLLPVFCQVMQLSPSSQFFPFRLDVEHLLYHHPPLISRAQLPILYWSLSLSTVENDISLAWNCSPVPPSASPILQIMNKM